MGVVSVGFSEFRVSGFVGLGFSGFRVQWVLGFRVQDLVLLGFRV